MRRWLLSGIILLMAITPFLPVQAQTTPPLLDLLALVPDTEISSRYLLYTDFAASEQAFPAPMFNTAMEFNMASSQAQELFIINAGRTRLARLSPLNFPLINQVPVTVGIQWFDMDRTLEWDSSTLIQGNFQQVDLIHKLQQRAFTQAERNGVQVWSRLEDGETNPEAAILGDPFDDGSGAAARIALLRNDLILHTTTWTAFDPVVALQQGVTGSLRDNPDYRALAEALVDPAYYSGSLITAVLYTPAETAQIAATPPDASGVVLPRYNLIGLADRQEGEQSVHLIGLVYPDEATARAAVTSLYERWLLDTSFFGSYKERYDYVFDAPHVYVAADGTAVAVVGVRYTIIRRPTLWEGAATPTIPTPGLMFFDMLAQIQAYQFSFLAAEQP